MTNQVNNGGCAHIHNSSDYQNSATSSDNDDNIINGNKKMMATTAGMRNLGYGGRGSRHRRVSNSRYVFY